MRDDRVHARMALVRDLFGLNLPDGSPGAQNDAPGAGAEASDGEFDQQMAEVRELPARGFARGTRRG
jgi:hypothetical protein